MILALILAAISITPAYTNVNRAGGSKIMTNIEQWVPALEMEIEERSSRPGDYTTTNAVKNISDGRITKKVAEWAMKGKPEPVGSVTNVLVNGENVVNGGIARISVPSTNGLASAASVRSAKTEAITTASADATAKANAAEAAAKAAASADATTKANEAKNAAKSYATTKANAAEAAAKAAASADATAKANAAEAAAIAAASADATAKANAAKANAIATASADATAKANTAEANAKAACRPIEWMPTANEVGALPDQCSVLKTNENFIIALSNEIEKTDAVITKSISANWLCNGVLEEESEHASISSEYVGSMPRIRVYSGAYPEQWSAYLSDLEGYVEKWNRLHIVEDSKGTTLSNWSKNNTEYKRFRFQYEKTNLNYVNSELIPDGSSIMTSNMVERLIEKIPTPDYTTNNTTLVSTITNLAPSKARGVSLHDPDRNCNWYQAVTNGVFYWIVEED